MKVEEIKTKAKIVLEAICRPTGNSRPALAAVRRARQGKPITRKAINRPSHFRGPASSPAHNVAALGRTLFTDYLVPVELAAALLLVATIGGHCHRRPPLGGLR